MATRHHSSSFLTQLLACPEFSDLTFVCSGEEFSVHKAIVCTQSAPIKAAVQGGFKETMTNRIQMDKFQPGIVRRLVQFMYTGDYDDPDHEGDSVQDHAMAILLGHIRVNSIGDYYQVDELVSLANSKIKHLLQDHDEDGKPRVAILPVAIGAAVESTGDRELLEILAEACASAGSMSRLLDMEEFRNLPVMSEFAIELVQVGVRRNQALKDELEETQRQLHSVMQQLEDYKATLGRAEQCVGILSATSCCRNCSSEFTCSISPSEWILRCAICRCRHSGAYM